MFEDKMIDDNELNLWVWCIQYQPNIFDKFIDSYNDTQNINTVNFWYSDCSNANKINWENNIKVQSHLFVEIAQSTKNHNYILRSAVF